MPLAFTEQGVAMLSAILKSDKAIEANIAIMRAFVKLRGVLISDSKFEKRLSELESKYDQKFTMVFNAIRELMSTHAIPRKRILGLAEDEEQN